MINSPMPLLDRLIHRCGKLFGLYLTSDQQLAIIDRLGQFDCVKGPGLFNINPWTQKLRGFFSIEPVYVSGQIPNIHTRDAVQTDVSVTLKFTLNPILLSREKAKEVVNWSIDFQKEYLLHHAQSALQGAVSKYYAFEIAGPDACSQVESDLYPLLSELVKEDGITLTLCKVRELNVPAELRQHFDLIAQWAATMLDLRRRDPHEFEQALRVQWLKVLQQMSVGKMFVEPPKPVSMPSTPHDSRLAPPQNLLPTHSSGTIILDSSGEESSSPSSTSVSSTRDDDEPLSRL